MADDLYLRLATEDDVDLLYVWANDKTTRLNSFNTEKIDYNTHINWYKNIMQDLNVVQYIFMKENVPIGQSRFVIDGIKAEIGYSLDKNYRNKGLGKKMIKLSIEKIKKDYPAISLIFAKVKPSNESSKKSLQENGFSKKYELFEMDIASISI